MNEKINHYLLIVLPIAIVLIIGIAICIYLSIQKK